MIKNFEDLKVWEKAHKLVLDVYKTTQKYPKEEIYCLVSQMRRAMISVAANIAEGKKRNSVADFMHFLNMADTSLEEVKYYLILSKDLKYITEPEMKNLYDKSTEVGLMLTGLERSLKKFKR